MAFEISQPDPIAVEIAGGEPGRRPANRAAGWGRPPACRCSEGEDGYDGYGVLVRDSSLSTSSHVSTSGSGGGRRRLAKASPCSRSYQRTNCTKMIDQISRVPPTFMMA